MGIGLYLVGRTRAFADDPLAVAERFFRHRYGADLLGVERGANDDGHPVLRVTTHPAAEAIEMTLREERIVVSAKTSTVGPGYHADVCEALHALEDTLAIAWEPRDEEDGTGDETGYFTTGDRGALEETMLRWLQAAAGSMRQHLAEGFGPLSLSMPMSPHYSWPPGAALLTQLGPRDEAWLKRLLDDPRTGIDVFPWWAPGRDAAYELGRVLVHLWLDVRFRPAATEEEETLGRELLGRLARAYRLDPSLPYPWAAWEALHDDVVDADDDDLSEMIRERAEDLEPDAIGYRQWDVQVALPGGWRITVPGSFSTELDEGGTWSAWADGETVWATAFTRADTSAVTFSNGISEGSTVEIDGLELPYRAEVEPFEENGESYWRTTAQIAKPGKLLLVSAVVGERERLDWAKQVIASVRG